MMILALDSSAKPASVALVSDGTLLSMNYQNCALTHSQTLLPMVRSVLACAGITLKEVELFAVSNGPGSFTGLRIGVGLVKGFAFAEDKPCVGVSPLEAAAEGAKLWRGNIVSVMDARAGQVYNAVFESDGREIKRQCNDRAISLEELYSELSENDDLLLVGDGAALMHKFLIGKGKESTLAPDYTRYQNAFGVACAAQKKYSKGQTTSGDMLLPVYLRPSQAERERSQRKDKDK